MRKGISPVIATVIIVAVAIAISIAVAGWIMGLWGGFGQTESLKIFPDSYINSTDNKTYIVIQNVGGSPAQIYRVDVGQATFGNGNNDFIVDEEPLDYNTAITGATPTSTVTIEPGKKVAIIIDLTGEVSVASGVAYTVTIYTESGNVYTAVVYGK